MTQEQILEFNKKCAKFIGATPQSLYPENKDLEQDGIHWKFPNGIKLAMRQNYTTANMKFHSDWNWIHEVIDAIENIQIKEQHIYSIQPRGATCEIKCSTQYSLAFDIEMPVIYTIGKSKKEAVVQAIDQFLDWYYESK